METEGFRKLDIDLPRHPPVNSKPWAKAGWILLVFVLCLMVLAYVLRKQV